MEIKSYLGTTKIKCNHNGTETEAIFYITNIPDTKITLGLRLCIDLGLIVVQCDDDCKCKSKKVQVAETSLSTPVENTQGYDDRNSMLPPVPLDTKIDETNPKAHVMQLYPDLFDGSWDYQRCCGPFRHKAKSNSYSMFTPESTRHP